MEWRLTEANTTTTTNTTNTNNNNNNMEPESNSSEGSNGPAPPKTMLEAKKAKGSSREHSLPMRSKLLKDKATTSATTNANTTAAAVEEVTTATATSAIKTETTAAPVVNVPVPPVPTATPPSPLFKPLEKKKRGSERNYVNGILMVKCQCRNPKDCRKIVTYWCQPPTDGSASKHRDGRRAGYIELPHNRRIEKTVLHEFENQRRERFFQYLTGGTSATETKTKKQTRDYVALHHFPPEILNADGSGLTQETVNATEALELGLTQQDRVTVQGYLSGVSFEGQYIVVPNYPWKNLVEEYLALGGDARELQGNIDDPASNNNNNNNTLALMGGTASATANPHGTPLQAEATSPSIRRPLASAALKTNGARGLDRVALLESRLEQKDKRIQEQDARIQEQDKRIQEQDNRIQEQDKRIQELESWTGITAMSSPTLGGPVVTTNPTAQPGTVTGVSTATTGGVLPSKKRKARI